MKKQKEFSLQILKIETHISRNQYRRSRDDGEPMIFSVHFAAITLEGQHAFFKHTLNFMRGVKDWVHIDTFERAETDFIRVDTDVLIKHRVGDHIRVVALAKEDLSRNGMAYLSLSRVRVVKTGNGILPGV